MRRSLLGFLVAFMALFASRRQRQPRQPYGIGIGIADAMWRIDRWQSPTGLPCTHTTGLSTGLPCTHTTGLSIGLPCTRTTGLSIGLSYTRTTGLSWCRLPGLRTRGRHTLTHTCQG